MQHCSGVRRLAESIFFTYLADAFQLGYPFYRQPQPWYAQRLTPQSLSTYIILCCSSLTRRKLYALVWPAILVKSKTKVHSFLHLSRSNILVAASKSYSQSPHELIRHSSKLPYF